jgi:hypothetical protein
MSHRRPLQAGPSSSSIAQDDASPSSSPLTSAEMSPIKHTKRRSEIDRDGESEGDMDVEGEDEEATGKSEASEEEDKDEDGEDRFLDRSSSSSSKDTGKAPEDQKITLIGMSSAFLPSEMQLADVSFSRDSENAYQPA